MFPSPNTPLQSFSTPPSHTCFYSYGEHSRPLQIVHHASITPANDYHWIKVHQLSLPLSLLVHPLGPEKRILRVRASSQPALHLHTREFNSPLPTPTTQRFEAYAHTPLHNHSILHYTHVYAPSLLVILTACMITRYFFYLADSAWSSAFRNSNTHQRPPSPARNPSYSPAPPVCLRYPGHRLTSRPPTATPQAQSLISYNCHTRARTNPRPTNQPSAPHPLPPSGPRPTPH